MRKLISYLCVGLLICAAQAQDVADSGSDPETHIEIKSDPVKQAKGAISVDNIAGVVYAADGKKQVSKEGQLGDKVFKAVKLGTGQSVEVSFTPSISGDSIRPQQAMLMAASKAHPGLAAYAVAKVKKDGLHVITLTTASIEKQIVNAGGELELSLLVGDPSAAAGVRGDLGSVILPEAASDAAPQPKLMSAKYQPRNNMKPNIAHTFRAPDKRAPAVVSLAFTGLAAAPLVLLLGYLGMLGVNFRGLPAGAANLWVLMFHGGIAAMLLLYFLFWLRLNLAQTLPIALALGCFVAGTGYKALAALSAQRMAESKSSSGPLALKKTN